MSAADMVEYKGFQLLPYERETDVVVMIRLFGGAPLICQGHRLEFFETRGRPDKASALANAQAIIDDGIVRRA